MGILGFGGKKTGELSFAPSTAEHDTIVDLTPEMIKSDGNSEKTAVFNLQEVWATMSKDAKGGSRDVLDHMQGRRLKLQTELDNLRQQIFEQQERAAADPRLKKKFFENVATVRPRLLGVRLELKELSDQIKWLSNQMDGIQIASAMTAVDNSDDESDNTQRAA